MSNSPPPDDRSPLSDSPWTASTDEALQALDVDPEDGLTDEQVRQRREQYGPNTLASSKPKGAWEILVDQFMSLIIGLLVAAAVVAFFFGEYVEMVAIFVVVIINAAIGFFTELRAVRSMEALQKIAEVSSRVVRDGQLQSVPARDLVPGDIVVVEAGNMIGADMRFLTDSELECDESVLTGESFPVEKSPEALPEDTPLAERTGMLYRGTAVTRGHGRGLVVGTGMQTEVGRISELVESAQHRETPLEQRLDELGRNLVWVCLVLAVVMGVMGWSQGKELFTVIETAIALAVATIPEGLPIVATLALARGVWRMAERDVLVRDLSVVETLGSANLILTDKTGTLTRNQMTVSNLEDDDGPVDVEWADDTGRRAQFRRDGDPTTTDDDPLLRDALEIGVLCNNEPVPEPRDDEQEEDSERKRIGEPMEMALLDVAGAAGLDPTQVRQRFSRRREVPFDADTKMMATFHRLPDDGPEDSGNSKKLRVAVKGAPEAVLGACSAVQTAEDGSVALTDETRRRWKELNEQWAASGLRVLAVAEKTVDDPEAEAYDGLELVGLVGMLDPPRTDVGPALEDCRSAGIRVVMMTGDQVGTAMHVAHQLEMVQEGAEAMHGSVLGEVDPHDAGQRKGLAGVQVFSRVSPEQKFNLVQLHQQEGNVVAMTGDGVNDAPALMQSDIGIAMGRRGTQVAREAADMVLGNDAFSSIVAAIKQGRIIFDNIRKFVVYLLSCNVSELMIISLASVAFSNAPLPLTALQILYLNLVTDVFPALALGFGEGAPDILERKPRDQNEPILTRGHWARIAGWGFLLTLTVLATFYTAFFVWEFDGSRAVTVSFLTLAFTQLWHVFNMRAKASGRILNEVTANPYVWAALGLCVLLLLVAVYVGPLATALGVVPPGLNGWLLALGASFAPALIGLLKP